MLRKRTEVAYEAEIPLAMQVFTSEDTIILHDPAEVFDHPEEYTQYGYEVYVITVSFRQAPFLMGEDLHINRAAGANGRSFLNVIGKSFPS